MVKGYTPLSLQEALEMLKGGFIQPYAGGTDINTQKSSGKDLLFINRLPELRKIEKKDGYISIGAAVTYSEAEENPLVPEIMKTAIKKVAGPAIRNLGTFGGNLANASGKADSALVDLVCDAVLHIQSASAERYLKVSDFYKGYRKTDLKPDELITEILIPDRNYFINFYYDKVSVRTAVAISNLSIAAVWNISGNVLTDLAIGIGSATVYPIRYTEIENSLVGMSLEYIAEHRREVLDSAISKLQLPPDRTSVYYRKRVCYNLLEYLIYEEFTPLKL